MGKMISLCPEGIRVAGRPSVSSSEESEPEGEDEEVPGSEGDDPNSEEDPHLGSEIAPVVNVERPDPKEAVLPPDVVVNKDSVGEDVLTDVSPLRTIFPPTSSEK